MHLVIQLSISNLVRTTCFCKNLHHVCSLSTDWNVK